MFFVDLAPALDGSLRCLRHSTRVPGDRPRFQTGSATPDNALPARGGTSRTDTSLVASSAEKGGCSMDTPVWGSFRYPSRYQFYLVVLLFSVGAEGGPGGPGLVSSLLEASPGAHDDFGHRTGSVVSGMLPELRFSGASRRPGVLLDRDGTIIVDHGYVGSVDRVEFIEGAAEAIARLNRAEVPVAIVSNQAGVARGLYDISDVETVHRYIAETLGEFGAHIDQFFYCPYHPEGTVSAFAHASDWRKPMPGMAHAAAEALNLDLSSSWMVGDRAEDMGLAKAVGASGLYVGSETYPGPEVRSFPDLSHAVSFILERIKV